MAKRPPTTPTTFTLSTHSEAAADRKLRRVVLTALGAGTSAELSDVGAGEEHEVELGLGSSADRVTLTVKGARKPWALSVHAGPVLLFRGLVGKGHPGAFAVDPRLLRRHPELCSDATWRAAVELEASAGIATEAPPARQAGSLLLRQRGAHLDGCVLLADACLWAEGRVVEDPNGTLTMHLDAADGRVAYAFAATVSPERMEGAFVAAGVAESEARTGIIVLSDVLFQETPPPDKLAWKKEYSSQAGPDDKRIRYRFRVERSDKGVTVVFVDEEGKAITTLPHDADLDKTVGSARVLAFDAVMNGAPIAKDAKWDGESKVILVQGCSKVSFVQFERTVTTVYPPPGSTEKGKRDKTPWRQDGKGTTYPGTLDLPSDAGADKGAMADLPGITPADGEAKRASAKKGFDKYGFGEKATFVYRIELETFVCCDKKLLGFVRWAVDLTWTLGKDGKVAGPVASKTKPTWNDAGSPSDNTVDCSKL
jgi:hypothetical protein